MSDFLGYVRVRVDRSKPLSLVPEVYLDRVERRDADGNLDDPPCTIGQLWLETSKFGSRLVFCGDDFGCGSDTIDVKDCLAE